MTKNITVIGIGKLGLCTALCIERAGYNVLGIDIFPDYVQKINTKTLISHEPKVMEYLNKSSNFRASTDLEEGLEFSDIYFVVLQTPNGGGENFYDHTHLNNLLVNINNYKVKNKNIVICCTVMPGYIENIGKSLISDCENTTLNYNPEFIAQGEIIKGFENPDIVLIGEENESIGDQLQEIYEKITHNTPEFCRLNPPINAEIVKIGINGFCTTKVAYANMIGDACDACGADKNKVLNSIGGDSRIGRKYFRPGYSFGGPCFPRDTKALGLFINSLDIDNSITESIHISNEFHAIHQARELLKENKESYLIEDICYKANSTVPIIEESAKLKIAKYLAKNNKEVIIKDVPHMILEVKKEYGNLFKYEEKN